LPFTTLTESPILVVVSGGDLAGIFSWDRAVETAVEPSVEVSADLSGELADDRAGGLAAVSSVDFRGGSTCKRAGEPAEPLSDDFKDGLLDWPANQLSTPRLLPLLSKISWEWRVTASALVRVGRTQRHGNMD
jgi:hypothetical protein